MSLYRRPGSNVWWMNIYRGPGRKRIQKSTGKTNEAEARIIEQGYMSMNKGESTRERLLKLVDLMCPAETAGLELKGLSAWYRACAEDEKMKISKKGLDDRCNLCGRLYEWARRETRCNVVDDVTPPIAWAFSQHLGKEGCSTKSRNDYVSSLGTVWKMLIKRAKATTNPWENAKVQRNHDEEEHGRAFTRDEVTRLLAEAKKAGHEWYEASVIALHTGMRLTDVRFFQWDEIDFESGWIHYRPKKTIRHNIKVDVPIHPVLRRLLDELAHNRANEEWVLPERHKNDCKKYFRGDVPFKTIIERAGIEPKPGETITFHCWRHTFDTRLAEAGVEQDVRMQMTGHTVKETERIYNHDKTRLEKAIAAMA